MSHLLASIGKMTSAYLSLVSRKKKHDKWLKSILPVDYEFHDDAEEPPKKKARTGSK